jgi:hypothetical protein
LVNRRITSGVSPNSAGCSVTWLARLHGVQKVAGSNPVTPTILQDKPIVVPAVGFLLGIPGLSPGKPSSNGVLFFESCRSKFAASRLPASDSRGSKSGRPDDFGNRFH